MAGAMQFCPSCGAPRFGGARFCGGCGTDLEALGGSSSAPVATVPPTPSHPTGAVARPARPAAAPSPPNSGSTPVRGRRPLLLAGLVVLVAIGAGVGAVLLLRPSSAPGQVAGSPFPNPIALTSPSASQVPDGLADPGTPAYGAGSGFTPDAIRVLTVTVLSLSLSSYHDNIGTYPATLDALFPTYAPPGSDGAPMTGPPSATEGYAYSATRSAYSLSVVLASGQSYAVTGP